MMNKATDEIEKSKLRADFWVKVAAGAFGLWSLMIPIGVAMLQSSVNRVVDANESFVTEFRLYMLNMEKRVTLLEERQNTSIRMLRDNQKIIDSLEHSALQHSKEK